MNNLNKIVVRFAPSPTGALHIGSVRTALYNYLFAKKYGGKFILRIEDTDNNRIISGSKQYIIDTLKWCKIEPDEGYNYGGNLGPYCQSERLHIYKKYINYLIKENQAYYAFDKLEDLEKIKLNLKKEGKIFSYNYLTRNQLNNSLNFSEKKTYNLLYNKVPYVIRLKIPKNINIVIFDLIRGKICINTSVLDDKILIKSDGNPTYHIASIIDDYLMNITHVIRGEEWLSSTPIHILLYKIFKWPIPKFLHLPLILNNEGKGKLSKRNLSNIDYPIFPLSWKDPINGNIFKGYSDIGYLPEAFINMIALLGWNPGNNKEIFSLQELIKYFDIKKINKSGIRFNKEKAIWFNKQHLQKKPLSELNLFIKNKIKNNIYNNNYINSIIKKNIKKASSMEELWYQSKYFFITPYYNKKIFNKIFNNFDQNLLFYIKNIQKLIYNITNNDFKHLFLKKKITYYIHNNCFNDKINIMKYLRLCLVGDLYGCEIFYIMEIIGKIETLKRLNYIILLSK